MPSAEQLVRRLLEEPAQAVKDPWTFVTDIDRQMLDEYYLGPGRVGEGEHLELDDAHGFVEWHVSWDTSTEGIKGVEIDIYRVDLTAEFTHFDVNGVETIRTEHVVIPNPAIQMPSGEDPKEKVMALARRDWTVKAQVDTPSRYRENGLSILRMPLRPTGITVHWDKYSLVVGF